MCDGVSAVYAVVAIAAAVGAGYVSYKSSQNAQDYNEKIAETNKKVLESQAQDAERQGQIMQQERRLKTRMQIATQQVGFGAQNVEQTGTALDILGDTAMFGQIDEDRIAADAARKAFGFRFQGWDVEAQKRLMQSQAKDARTGTILSTVSSIAGTLGGGGWGTSGGGYKVSDAGSLSTSTYSPGSYSITPLTNFG
jgi:hypothetical protein